MGIGRDPVTGKQRYKRKSVSAKNITEARKLLKAMVAEAEPETGTTNITVARLADRVRRSGGWAFQQWKLAIWLPARQHHRFSIASH